MNQVIKNNLEKISGYIDEHREEMIELWGRLVNMESNTNEVERVTALAEFLKEQFEAVGMKCSLLPTGTCPTLTGIIGIERGGKPIVFSGHMDTVFPYGTFGENPFRIEDGRAYGPGVLDMKGGIVIALYVIKALEETGYKETPLKILFSGDEETAHYGSNGRNVFRKEAEGGLFAFNMETGLVDNCICIGRKGRLAARINVSGVSAHAGNDFTAGHNAIEEMALKVTKIQALTNLEEGTTVNVGVISGGTVCNSVPDRCSIEAEIRYTSMKAEARLRGELERIVSECSVEKTFGTLEFLCNASIYETNDAVMELYDYLCQTAREYGFEVPGKKKLGGFSDAPYVLMAGTPVLCSCGVRGQWNHTDKEYALVETLFERTKLLAAAVLNHKEFMRAANS